MKIWLTESIIQIAGVNYILTLRSLGITINIVILTVYYKQTYTSVYYQMCSFNTKDLKLVIIYIQDVLDNLFKGIIILN